MKTTHQACPCGISSDAYSINEKGWGKCFSCDKKFPPSNGRQEEEIPVKKLSSEFAPLTNVFHAFKERGIDRETISRFGVSVDLSSSDVEARYPVFANGVHVGNKIRKTGKKFLYEGQGRDLDLFGQHTFSPGSAKAITILEGQDDAMAAFQISPFPAVSVHGASSAIEDCKRNYEYLNSFESIIVCFDRDEAKINPLTGEKHFPGQEAAIKVAGLFKPGKAKILTLREFKDANEYLLNGRGKQFVNEWWKAVPYQPDGLILGTQMWDTIINRPNHFTVPLPFEETNKLTYGLRLSEFVLVHAPTGVGKTSYIKEIEHSLLVNKELIEKGYGVGFLHLEEPNHDTALGLMSVHNSKPYHLPDTERTTDELRAAYDAVINTDRVVIWDHFGSNTVDAVLDKVRHMHALGCKYVVVDHLSIIVSDQSGDERKQLDEISTKLKTLCMELNIALICVIHQNRAGLVRGTAGVEQVANIVIRLERDKTATDPYRRNVTKTVVEKNRFSGMTGPASYLHYNGKTGRMVELDPEEVIAFEAGETKRDDQFGWT